MINDSSLADVPLQASSRMISIWCGSHPGSAHPALKIETAVDDMISGFFSARDAGTIRALELVAYLTYLTSEMDLFLAANTSISLSVH